MPTINHVFITMNPATINHIITMEPTILPIELWKNKYIDLRQNCSNF